MQRAGPGTRHYLCKELQEVSSKQIVLELHCGECDAVLDRSNTRYIPGELCISVCPCSVCLEKARCEAEEEGRQSKREAK